MRKLGVALSVCGFVLGMLYSPLTLGDSLKDVNQAFKDCKSAGSDKSECKDQKKEAARVVKTEKKELKQDQKAEKVAIQEEKRLITVDSKISKAQVSGNTKRVDNLTEKKEFLEEQFQKKHFRMACRGGVKDVHGYLEDPVLLAKCCRLLRRENAFKIAGMAVAVAVATVASGGAAGAGYLGAASTVATATAVAVAAGTAGSISGFTRPKALGCKNIKDFEKDLLDRAEGKSVSVPSYDPSVEDSSADSSGEK